MFPRESFDPKSTLVRPDMRILVGTRESKPTQLKHDDVLIVPDFFCPANNWDIYNTLVHEMRDLQKKGEKGSEWISWHEGAHLISKNPTSSPTFQKILSDVAQYFSVADLTSIGTRFNWYRDSNDWKPFHHDSAAFNRDRAKRQNITIGVSFGASRELAFLNAKNDTRLYFPQTNGMLFRYVGFVFPFAMRYCGLTSICCSFGRDVNIKWKHGVNFCAEEVQRLQEKEYAGYLAHDVTLGRISIILWGLCGVTVEEAGSPPMLTDNTRGNGHHIHKEKFHGDRDVRRGDSRNRDRGYSGRASSRDRDGGFRAPRGMEEDRRHQGRDELRRPPAGDRSGARRDDSGRPPVDDYHPPNRQYDDRRFADNRRTSNEAVYPPRSYDRPVRERSRSRDRSRSYQRDYDRNYSNPRHSRDSHFARSNV